MSISLWIRDHVYKPIAGLPQWTYVLLFNDLLGWIVSLDSGHRLSATEKQTTRYFLWRELWHFMGGFLIGLLGALIGRIDGATAYQVYVSLGLGVTIGLMEGVHVTNGQRLFKDRDGPSCVDRGICPRDSPADEIIRTARRMKGGIWSHCLRRLARRCICETQKGKPDENEIPV